MLANLVFKVKEYYYKKTLSKSFRAWFRATRPGVPLTQIVSEARERCPFTPTKWACIDYLNADQRRYRKEAEKDQEVPEELVKNIDACIAMQQDVLNTFNGENK